MNPLDRKFTKLFKVLLKSTTDECQRNLAMKDFRELRGRVSDSDLGATLEGLLANVSAQPGAIELTNTTDPCRVIKFLRERGFAELSAVFFQRWCGSMAKKTLDEVIALAPDATSLEAWRKAALVPVNEMQTHLLTNPSIAYATAGADWLLLHAKAEQNIPILELLLHRKERPQVLPDWTDALVSALKKDKRGVLLEEIIRQPWLDPGMMATLGGVVRLNRDLFKQTLDLLPSILCKKDAPAQGIILVRELFATLTSTEGTDRVFFSASLARLGCGLLLEHPANHKNDFLEFVRQTARHLRNITSEKALGTETWVLENLCGDELPRDAGLHVTIDGARQLAIAMEKAAKGFDSKEILSVTARNLGLLPIGKKGDQVSFFPIKHLDVEGGMLPGDAAQIEEAGWSYQDDVIVRAKVRKPRE